VGYSLSKFQARYLVVFGLFVSAFGLYMMTRFDLTMAFQNAVLSRVVQSFGLAFLFVPINTLAFAAIAKEKVSYASGLINLARNIGGSTGIALMTTMLSRRSQFHQQILVNHLTPYDPTYWATLQGITAKLTQQGVAASEAAQKAQAVIYGMMQRQAAMLAFIDIFLVLALTFLCLIPLVLMMKPMKPHKAEMIVD
jgi:MFS transporter, DHA2 family, multidrug resistance protein